MGLLDILTGMQNGPRGQPQSGDQRSGGMSPITMALLGLLAYKAVKSGGLFGGGSAQPQPAGTDQTGMPPSGQTQSGGLGGLLGSLFGGGAGGSSGAGGLASMIPGGLGGLLGGAAGGSVVSGGLSTLIKDLQKTGQGDAAQSWVGSGPNQEIAPDDLARALGSDTIDTLSRQTGMDRNELLQKLSEHLPDFVNQLTPQGRVPTEEEANRLM